MVAGAGPVSARKPGDAVPAESLGVSGVVLGHWLSVPRWAGHQLCSA